MKDEYTAYEIWKAIHYTHPQKLEEQFGFDAMTVFIRKVRGKGK